VVVSSSRLENALLNEQRLAFETARHCTNSIVATQDHCSYKAPSTKPNKNKKIKTSVATYGKKMEKYRDHRRKIT